MYDIKYAPFADSYIGMAHGDTYEHVKRWLKQRFTFVDTLFDYAPSYNNDVLTIRANTTELMTLEIETYTPVYQHLSWYNGQMDKKKIDGKVSVEFSGTAQAATDQEVLIYGGSNVKSIKGITSMNPNRMLIGSATKLVEIDAHDCPLLADINANKANLSPHEYLNKVDLSNCPLLEGNLRLNNSPLVQEINIKGTKITGMNLPSSIRNLQVLRLPNTITELTLNDAGMLHTLEFDEGAALQSISMTNCNALENVINFDLLQTPSITLNNSYNTAAELYFRDTTNLSLSNMSNLERVIFTPNNEYETFELINVANAPDYTVTTFNCPKLSTFITTAPYRESYNNGDYGDIQPNTTFTANSIDISSTQFTDVKLLCTTDTNTLKLPTTVKNFYCDSSFDLDTDYLEDGEYDVVHGELVEQYTTDYEGEVVRPITQIQTIKDWNSGQMDANGNITSSTTYFVSDFISPIGDFTVTPTGANYFCLNWYNEKKEYIGNKYAGNWSSEISYSLADGGSSCKYFRICSNTEALSLRFTSYVTPDLIPSSADGSLIFSMYAPSNAVAPASGTWDLKGLEFDNFHTFGMNNDVKPSEVVDYCILDAIIGDRGGVNDVGATLKTRLATCFIPKALYNTPTDVTIPNWNNAINKWCLFSDGTLKLGDPLVLECDYVALQFYTTSDVTIENTNKSTFKMNGILFTINIIENTSDNASKLNGCNAVTSISSIAMPARYDDYNITIKNAYIKPTTHNTMLYPLLVNEDNPITGTLDYTNYTGKHLSWSFAYTDEEYVNIIQPKNELLNSYEYKYNAFYDTEYEFDNPYEVARYTSNASGVLPSFNSEFTYTYDEIDNGDGTYTTKIYADSLDNLPTSFSFYTKSALLSVERMNISKVTSAQGMFYQCSNVTYINSSNWNTSSITNMSNTFNGCKNLTTLDVSGFDTSNVTTMNSMFAGCSGLTSLDVSEFDTSKVTSMSYMFQNCSALESIDISNWDVSKVTNMDSVFRGCNKLTSLNVSGFNTSNVITMSRMFNECKNLTSLDLSNFDTSKVTNMDYMFSTCNNLTTLDVSGFDMSKITTMRSMLGGCSNLTTLDSMQNISVALDLSSTILDATSLLDVINNLATITTTQTLTLGSTLLAKLTEDQIAIAVNKGWTVS